MGASIGFRAADLRRLRAITDRAHLVGTDERLPRTVLEALYELIPCDQVTYEVLDPVRREWVVASDLFEEFCFDVPLEFFWPAFWASKVCSHPQRSGDHHSVVRVSDFYSRREFKASATGELFRLQDADYNLLVPLPSEGNVDHRVEFWRSGSDFTDAEQMLLTLLRPHLAEFEQAAFRRGSEPVLTARQTELVGLLAEGLTNRQIGRRLDIAEGTVRRHLENIFERLNVTSRAAAAAYYARLGQPSVPLVPLAGH